MHVRHLLCCLQVDTYAFGIMLWELAHHCMETPFSSFSNDQLQRGEHVRGSRPPLPRGWPAAYTELMAECWAELPQDRPCFEAAAQRLQALLDSMMEAACAEG
jgi:hypothetical protein